MEHDKKETGKGIGAKFQQSRIILTDTEENIYEQNSAISQRLRRWAEIVKNFVPAYNVS